MKTLKELKARVQPGVRMLCVENTKRPELNGTIRIVNHVQGNAFTWEFEAFQHGGSPVEIMLNPKKYGYVECTHCTGYGSSLRESADRCAVCGGRGLVKQKRSWTHWPPAKGI